MVRAQEVVRPDGGVVRRKPRLGDMQWDGTVWRRWSGRRWASAVYSPDPPRLRQRTRLDADPPIARTRALNYLDRAVEDQVTNNGASVVFVGPSGVVLGYRRRVAHGFHAVLTLLTGGLWAVVWLAVALGAREDRVRLSVDPWGNVWAAPAARV